MRMEDDTVDAGWLPKSLVCLRYYSQFRFRSDVRASPILTAPDLSSKHRDRNCIGIASNLWRLLCRRRRASGFGAGRIKGPDQCTKYPLCRGSCWHRRPARRPRTLVVDIAGGHFSSLPGGHRPRSSRSIHSACDCGLSNGVAVLVRSDLVPNFHGVRPLIFADKARTGVVASLQNLTDLAIRDYHGNRDVDLDCYLHRGLTREVPPSPPPDNRLLLRVGRVVIPLISERTEQGRFRQRSWPGIRYRDPICLSIARRNGSRRQPGR